MTVMNVEKKAFWLALKEGIRTFTVQQMTKALLVRRALKEDRTTRDEC